MVASCRHSSACSRCSAQPLGAGLRAAQAQVGHLVDALQQRIERAEMGEQRRGRLRADARHAGDVVDRVAGAARGSRRSGARARRGAPCTPSAPQRWLRAKSHCSSPSPSSCDRSLSAETITRACRAAARRARRVPIRSSASYSACASTGTPRDATQRLAVRELAPQLLRRGFAVGLVRRIQRIAEARVQRLVERDRDMLRARAVQQFQQEAREALHRVARPAIGVVELVGHRMPRPEHVQTGVDQVERGRGRVTRRSHGCSSDCASGRSRSGASSFGVPMWMKPATCSSAASPSHPSTSRS